MRSLREIGTNQVSDRLREYPTRAIGNKPIFVDCFNLIQYLSKTPPALGYAGAVSDRTGPVSGGYFEDSGGRDREGRVPVKIDQKKLRELIAREIAAPSPDELRREENVFFVGGNLPQRPTLETLFESHYQCNAALFHLTFGDIDSFHVGETLARTIKKNFNTHLVGRLDFPAPSHLIERAYAAGVDILDIPLARFDGAPSAEERAIREQLRAIDCARSVFPRWSVVSTLTAGEAPSCSTMAGIDALLAMEVVPLLTLSGSGPHRAAEELSEVFAHLAGGWRRKKAAIKPLLPLIHLSTPFVQSAPRGGVRGFIDSIDERRLLATSDLRRILRVKEVEESFTSAGL